jgi:hypothetical protein
MAGLSMRGWNVWNPLPLERLKHTDFILGEGRPFRYGLKFGHGACAKSQVTPWAL